tara:strand:+ start:89 stop:265 length:177 start_codon:yes stop_codon:yes gene_type:complete
MTNKTYSLKFITPKRFLNKPLIVKAKNPKEAKELMLEFLHKINKRFVKVYEEKEGSNE